jgi:hypothetical protein
MKQCVDCRRRGLFLRLDSRGLCEACAVKLEQRLDRRVGEIRGALAAVEAMHDVDWIVEELGRAEKQCRELARLERDVQGRPSPRTEVLQRTVAERRDRVLNRWAETVAAAAVRQTERLRTPDQRAALLQEALQRLHRHQDKPREGAVYRARQRTLASLLVRVQSQQAAGAEAAPPEPALQLVGGRDYEEPPAREEPPAFAPPQPADRRRSSRRRKQLTVTLSPGGDRCLSEDVSTTGMLLRSADEQRVGDFLDLQLHTAKGRFRTTGIVVWTGVAGDARGLPNTLGVAFTGGVPVAAA